MPPITLIIPWDPARLSTNRTHRMHWREVAAERRIAAQWAAVAYLQAGQPTLEPPVKVAWTVRRSRVMDLDNVASGLKTLRDSLFVRGIVHDDSPVYISEETITLVKRPGPAQVVVTVETV